MRFSIKYRYDIGANIEAVSPAPAGNSYGKTTKRIFDSIERLDKESVFVNTAEQSYTRYEYPTSGIHSKAFATVIDTNSNGPDAADEVLSETWTDGAGRVRFARVPHTFDGYGQTATWAATVTEYDMLGRVSRQSVPTEVNGSFDSTGDGLSQTIMRQNDFRFSNIRLNLFDSNTWENWGSDFHGAAARAFANWGIHQMSATLNMGVSWSGFNWAPQRQTSSPLIQVVVADCSNDNATSTFPFINSAIEEGFMNAMAAINNAIGPIGFTEMFRTTEHQQSLQIAGEQRIKDWERSWKPSVFGLNSKPFPVAPAGTSSHEAGYSFDIPISLLKGPRGVELVSILSANGFVRDIMNHPTFVDDPIHFTHHSWGDLSDEEKKLKIAKAQKAYSKFGFRRTPGIALGRPRASIPECN